MKILCRLYLSAAYLFAISAFIVISVTFNCLSWVTLKIPGVWGSPKNFRNILQRYFIFWARLMKGLGILHLTTPEKTDHKTANGEMWLCNHPTILDGSYLLKFISNGSCIYKSAIGSNPCYGSTVKLAEYIPNIGGPDMIRNAADKLKDGQDLVVFPEGTRSTKLNTDLFKSGFALIAKRVETNINLLWMENPEDFLTREAPLWKIPNLPATVTIHQFDTIKCDRKTPVGQIFKAVIASYEKQAALSEKQR